MTDFENVMFWLKQYGIDWKSYKSKKFIADEAIKAGAKYTVCIRDTLDICFDGNGNVIGNYTEHAGSFRARYEKLSGEGK